MLFNSLLLISMLFSGLSVSLVCRGCARWLIGVWQNRQMHDDYQSARRTAIRAKSPTMRLLEPIADLLQLQAEQSPWLNRALGYGLAERCIGRGGTMLPWMPAELIAVRLLESFLLGSAACCLLALGGSRQSALVSGAAVAGAYLAGSHLLLYLKAKNYMATFKQRLPYGIDLIAIMMQSGEPFPACLETVAEVNRGHPLGIELSRALGQHQAGKPLGASLETMSRRLKDADVEQIVDATINSEKLGTPLSTTYLRLADQMRLRRSQRAEEAAGRAQATIVLPGFIVMAACMVIVVAPFVLQAVSLSGEFSGLGG